MLEDSILGKIATLQREASPWMGSNYGVKAQSELTTAASVNQEVYDFALNRVGQELEFWEKGSSLGDSLLSLVKTEMSEVQESFRYMGGDIKGAAYQLICRKLDPQFDPVWSPLSLEDLPGLLIRVETLLQEISLMGANSPLVTELITYLSNVSGVRTGSLASGYGFHVKVLGIYFSVFEAAR